jgi:hypothetical protein
MADRVAAILKGMVIIVSKALLVQQKREPLQFAAYRGQVIPANMPRDR